MIGIITQSALVRFLGERRDLFGPLGEVKVRRFIKPGSPVVTLERTATLRTALRTLLAAKISAAPIVDADGNILANFSFANIRVLGKMGDDVLDRAMDSNVHDFLKEMHPGSRALRPLVLHPEDSFGTAVELLSVSGVHRVYIVEGRRPVGVVSLSDVLSLAAPPVHRQFDDRKESDAAPSAPEVPSESS